MLAQYSELRKQFFTKAAETFLRETYHPEDENEIIFSIVI